VLATTVEDGFEAGWPAVRLVFEEASQKLTREDILAEWPADHAKPNAVTPWRWPSRGVELGQIVCERASHRPASLLIQRISEEQAISYYAF
jgi:hypothetical protein